MRPIKLTMTAFGPYRDEQTIDFTELQDHRLFVISGMTGAGKTSIFDAISYALYGTASGEDRSDFRMLRSHFAGDEVHTSVDFIFASGNRTYRVFRQMGHRKKGNKNETGGKIELYEVTNGEETPCARFTVSDVNAKLEQIIGLTKEQFSQIVMLPQGEFRKLLTSETENKENILRRIFRTQLYERLEAKFYEQSKQLRDRHTEANAKLTVQMHHAAETMPEREGSLLSETLQQEVYSPRQVMDGLRAEQAYYAEQTKHAEQKRQALAEKLQALESQYLDAKELNMKFAELEQQRAKMSELASRQEAMQAMEQQLQRAEQAARLKPYEEQAVQAAQAAERIAWQHREAERHAQSAKQQLAEARAHYEREAAREEERKRAEAALNRLRELEPVVASLDHKRREVADLQAKRAALISEQEQLDQRIAEHKQILQQMSDDIVSLESAVQHLPRLLERLDRKRQKARLLQELVGLEQQLDKWAEAEEQSVKQLEIRRREHDEMEAAWLEGQASLLAMHLHEGQPCPVCGSVDHPRKATADSPLPSREHLAKQKEALRQAEQELHAAQAQIAAAQANKQGKLELLQEYGIAPEHFASQLTVVISEGKALSQEVAKLQKQSDRLAQLRTEHKQRLEQSERIALEREQTLQSLQEIAVQHSKVSALLESELERIPAGLQAPEQLASEIREQQAQLDKLTAAWQEAQRRLQEADKLAAEASSLLSSAVKQSHEAALQAELAERRFIEEIEKAGFGTKEQYAAAQASERERDSWREQLSHYRDACLLVREQVQTLERMLQDKQPADLSVLEAAVNEKRQELDIATAQLQSAARFEKDAKQLLHAVDQAYQSVTQLEAELAKVLDLYQVMKGDNPLKMSFERYILIEYLEQILQAANVRLQALSNGQYWLQRSDRLEARGRQSGLGLDVYDAYTGQNRDVKTLSGGEKFNASLALALGMTDVIQAHQGGVSIEMMFIDEGFGSLDEESLNKAVATLIDLQKSGRMIGVISHVPELKEAFPAIIEVTKTREGSSRATIRIK